MTDYERIDEAIASIREIGQNIRRILGEDDEQKQPTETGFTEQELRDLLQNELDFTKRIVTPLKGNRHQTDRYQNL